MQFVYYIKKQKEKLNLFALGMGDSQIVQMVLAIISSYHASFISCVSLYIP